jgi:transposase
MEQVIFLDESGFNTSMTRSYARAHSTLRAIGTVPRNHGINYTLICGLRLSGPVGELIIDGSVNGMVFEHYIRDILCPQLTEGQTVVMDNLSSHHRESIRGLIEGKGCKLLYLPSYSPDFNPIEMMFSKVKALVRGWGKRSGEELIQAVWDALAAVSRGDILGWFRCIHPGMVL